MLGQLIALALLGQGCPGGVCRSYPAPQYAVQAPAFPPQVVAGVAMAPEGARVKVKVRHRGFHPFRRRCHG